MADGRKVPLSELQSGYNTALELRLSDADQLDLLRTVSLAYRGDQGALAKLQELQQQVQPPAAAPQPVAVPAAPVAPAAPVMAATPPGTFPAPAAVPAAQPAPAVAGTNEAIAATLKSVLEPIARRLDRVDSYMDGIQAQKERGVLASHLEINKERYPRLAGNERATDRVLERWHGLQEAAKGGAAAPDQHDLRRIFDEEEAYLSAGQPAAAPAGTPGVEVTRMDEPPERIPGRPVPGRSAAGPVPAVVSAAGGAPTVMPVATTAPPAGAPGPAVTQDVNRNQPITRDSLQETIAQQARGLGVKQA
jgi:hypothetical protein